ncbi:hypothetical protein JOF42_002357 [Microbacterium phyllosphaerae]|uniref:Uncharacterized protein n=1 Tax=Microbacterium phyllosphaerae TaxID=124798 RepID=A0ABS4WRN5_9MICO|nr:hypothetical protein [Microbacterium phyllosphaerae]MBP2378862.1 hypothetical protein [Microbacterium phyllosphaerae]
MLSLTYSHLALVHATGPSSSAPWWGAPVIAGSFLVLGAVLAFVFNLTQENRRTKRANVERWDQKILDHTSMVMTTTRQLIQDSFDHETALSVFSELAVDQMHRGESNDPPPIRERSGTNFYETFDALMGESSSLQLIAPKGVRDAINDLQTAAGDLFFAENELVRSESVDRLHRVSAALEKSVRKHFGIKD